MAKAAQMKTKEVDLVLIDEPSQIDRFGIDQDYIEELANNIQEQGLLQSILLRPVKDRYEIIAGHCRFLAHKRLGLLKIRANIRLMDDAAAALARATENLARKNLTPMEEATVYRRLIDDRGLTIDQVAKKMGKSGGVVKRRLDLIRMPSCLQDAVHKKLISVTVAEELWPISDLASLEYYLSFAIDSGCTKETARIWSKEWKDSVRREGLAAGGVEQIQNPYEPRPTYMPCDLCDQPVELGKESTIRACPDCAATIKENM